MPHTSQYPYFTPSHMLMDESRSLGSVIFNTRARVGCLALMSGKTCGLCMGEGIDINTALALCRISNLRTVVAKSTAGFDDPFHIGAVDVTVMVAVRGRPQGLPGSYVTGSSIRAQPPP